MEDIEKVQKKATKLIPELKRMNHIDRLKKCQLPTLHYRRIRGDMIETYKIVSGKYDSILFMYGIHYQVMSLMLIL